LISRGMHLAYAWRGPVWAALLSASFGSAAHAQSTPVWPEVDTFVKLTPTARLHGLATTVQENAESTEGEFGVDVDFYHAPLRKNPKLLFRLHESKNRLMPRKL
jgi:hypothetical protein